MLQINQKISDHVFACNTSIDYFRFYKYCCLILSALFISVTIGSSIALAKKPKPNVQANAANFSITTNPDNTISIDISMDAGDQNETDADWWLAAGTPAGWYYYKNDSKKWVYSGLDKKTIQPAHQGPLFSFNTLQVDNIVGLPSGQYQLLFAVDLTMDGKWVEDESFQDSVFVNISEDSTISVTGDVTILDVNEQSGDVDLTLSALDNVDLSKALIQVSERLEETGEQQLVLDNAKTKKVNQALPIRFAMILDRSGSLNNNEESLMEQGVLQMLDFLRNGDQIEVINVATNFFIDASFRDFNAAPVVDAIENPSVTKGWTRIYDAIIQGIEDAVSHAQNSSDQKAVLVITDGEDNRSESTLDDVIILSQANNTPVFVVGLADKSDPSDLDSTGLTRLAQETGGRYVETFSPEFFSNILSEFARSLTAQYNISYVSPFATGKRTIILNVQDGDTTHIYEKTFTP